MIKLNFALRRLPELSRQEFQRIWRDEHALLVEKHREALRIRRYVQLHTMEHEMNETLRASRGGPEPFDGIAEIWWSSLDDLQKAVSTPEGAAAGAELLEDERRFIDLANSPTKIGEYARSMKRRSSSSSSRPAAAAASVWGQSSESSQISATPS